MKKTILVVDDTRVLREILRSELEGGGYEVIAVENAEEALATLADRRVDLILTDLVLPKMDGIEFLGVVHGQRPMLPVVLMTAYERSADAAVAAIDRGASDYLIKPLKEGEALFCVGRLLHERELEEHVEYLEREVGQRYAFSNIIGKNPAMRGIYDTIEVVAETDSTVLITGETGTGKELVARAIHWASPRKDKRFLTINCGALPVDLLESELFGHEKGAFTGAIRLKVGKFEYGDGGTVFLDEVGEIPPPIQVKILRVLQERSFERVGGNQPIKVDVRILAATNKDLAAAIVKGEFREDLFYRLNVVPLRLPPLRERKEDIALLARHFLDKCRDKFKREVENIAPEAMGRLMQYNWPGNVRELENVIERAVIMARGSVIRSIPLPTSAIVSAAAQESAQPSPFVKDLAALSFEEATEMFERAYFQEVLSRATGRISVAANQSGLNPRTLNRKMNKYELDKKNYKRTPRARRAALRVPSQEETTPESALTGSGRTRP